MRIPHELNPRLVLHYRDLTDSTNLIRNIQQVQPDEISNLGYLGRAAHGLAPFFYIDALKSAQITVAAKDLGERMGHGQAQILPALEPRAAAASGNDSCRQGLQLDIPESQELNHRFRASAQSANYF